MKKIGILVMIIALTFVVASCGNIENVVDAENVTNTVNVEDIVEIGTEVEGTENLEKIIVYLSGSEAMITKLEETFEEVNGDVLDLTIMSCGQLRSKVWTESKAGNIQADVVWGSDPLVYNKLDEAGKLMPLEISELANIDSSYIWENKHYAIVSERYIVIIYNRMLMKEMEKPESYADLVNEEYNGLVVMADASQSSTAFAITSALYELEGNSHTYFENLKNNRVMLTKSNGLVPSTILEGQYIVGIAPHDAVVRMKNKSEKEGFEVPLDTVWPSEGVIALQRPIAIPINDKRSEGEQRTAEMFVNFIVSKQAQTIMSNFGFVSVRTDIENNYLPEGVESFSVDWDSATENEDDLKDSYEVIFHE